MLPDLTHGKPRRLRLLKLSMAGMLRFLTEQLNSTGPRSWYSASGLPASARVVSVQAGRFPEFPDLVYVLLESPEFEELEPGRLIPEIQLRLHLHWKENRDAESYGA